MKILNVTAQKPDSTGSGVYLTELMKGFHKMGHDQALVAGVYVEDEVCLMEGEKAYFSFFHTEELPFSIVGMSDEMPYKSTRYCDMTPEMTMQFRKAYEKRICQALEEFKPDVILCQHLYYLTALIKEMSGNVPVYAVCHGSDLRQFKKNPWQKEYIKNKIPTLNGIFALHEEQKEEICRIFECEKDLVKVIGTGYNSEVFYRMDAKQINQADDRDISLVFAGKVSEKKGVMSLLRSLNHLDDSENNYQLYLVGGHGNEEEYKIICDLAQKSKVPVNIMGRVDQDVLVETMNAGDIFLLPSFYEGLPLVVVEAMACGEKVICTDLPGIRPWLNATVPHHDVEFITPPKMQNEDEPLAEELPRFEMELAQAISKKAQQIIAERTGVSQKTEPDLGKVSWMGLCEVILKEIQR